MKFQKITFMLFAICFVASQSMYSMRNNAYMVQKKRVMSSHKEFCQLNKKFKGSILQLDKGLNFLKEVKNLKLDFADACEQDRDLFFVHERSCILRDYVARAFIKFKIKTDWQLPADLDHYFVCEGSIRSLRRPLSNYLETREALENMYEKTFKEKSKEKKQSLINKFFSLYDQLKNKDLFKFDYDKNGLQKMVSKLQEVLKNKKERFEFLQDKIPFSDTLILLLL